MTISTQGATRADDRPWYRYWWPWLSMIPPGVAVIAGLLTAWLAGGPPALVVDDYANIARVTVERAERDQLAQDLGLSGSLTLTSLAAQDAPKDTRVSLSLRSATPSFGRPEQLILEIIHPTREDFDRQVELRQTATAYVGEFQRPAGRLYLQLSDPNANWRLTGELQPAAERLQLQSRSARSAK